MIFKSYNRLPRRQQGAALLAFMLILITGTSYLLLNKLNAALLKVGAEEQTRQALNQAKQALIGYAVTYPDHHPGEGPGYLVCPDRDNDGMTDAGACSLTSSGGTSIGRFPYKTLEEEDLRDSHGDRLWYIVANNFRNNPKKEPLNSETAGDPSGSLTVNGIPDIAAVIFAPGAPQDGQNRNTGPNTYSNYLEFTIAADAATSVTTITTSDTDNYILLTKDELMRAVEKRVLGEVKIFLSNYFSDTTAGNNNAYPWLTPFADPKAIYHGIQGSHDGTSGASDLTDSSMNFVNLGIQNGDIVRNITDGSIAAVTAVSTNTLTLSSLTLGVDNDFDAGDEYEIYSNMSGTATGGSGDLTLEDNSRDFGDYGVVPGDIVDNLTDNSSGMVESVSSNELTVTALTGGTNNVFASGDIYQIRNDYGKTTGGNNNSDLIDANRDFITMGIKAGDLVVNLTDKSIGRVSSVTSATTLKIGSMYFGTDNDFDTSDYYYFPRYITDGATREGLLSFHQPGKYFKTAFSIDWSTKTGNGATVSDTIGSNSPNTTYENDLRSKVQTSTGNIGTISMDKANAQCEWLDESTATCSGVYEDSNFPVMGTVTSGSNTSTLTDSNANFLLTAVKRGDIVENFDDEIPTGISGTATAGTSSLVLKDSTKNFNALGIIPYYHLIHDTSDSDIRGLITGIIDNNTLQIEGFAGRPSINLAQGHNYIIYTPQEVVVDNVNSATQLSTTRLTATAPDFDYNSGGGGPGGYQEVYQVKIATGKLTGTADFMSSSTTLHDNTADFSEIEIGDIVKDTTDNAYGIITAVTANSITAQTYTSSGATKVFNPGEGYEIYYNHDVQTRRYEFKTQFSGSSNVYSSGNQRKRDVCMGYGADCSSTASNVTLSRQNSLVTIRDLDIDGNEVGRATVNVTGSTQGSIKITGLDYYLSEATDEIPGWFITNNWYQLVYVAYSADYVPGGAANCSTSGNCLTSTGSGAPDNNKQIVVLIAGQELGAQERATAGIDDYFELQNASQGDDVFQHGTLSTAYNDQDKLIQ